LGSTQILGQHLTDKKILFIQVTEPAAYPPLINAALVASDFGWRSTFLSSPNVSSELCLPSSEHLTEIKLKPRRRQNVQALDYIKYCWASMKAAWGLKPKIIYVSDPLGAFPGLVAAFFCHSQIVYHEHDSPKRQSDLHWLFRIARRAILERCDACIFPNEARALLTELDLGVPLKRLKVIWNTPRVSELPRATSKHKGSNDAFVLYYHGSISRDRLPRALIETVVHFKGRLKFWIAGYETESGKGLIEEFQAAINEGTGTDTFRYLGTIKYREELLIAASQADFGLAIVPARSDDANLDNMAGASNKVFDYMAAGVIPLVTDLPEWNSTYVQPGYAIPVNPDSASSLIGAIENLMQDTTFRLSLVEKNRAKIVDDWNYETIFGGAMVSILMQ